ncbi:MULTISPECIES: DUF1853 family protein [unclassified Herbaspirillum]|uniref:DUF1853 family protein n=1 Tax=unclassified Herbaspirillum TaxID=2624150 RepID=UPI000E2F1092|nr:MULTISPECIES: DUF1853 family protein [unclassified Herbaspirillum]RFB72806.1 DUF1853 family protein [Herbaspirillum sp. 3R-3a1]TFI11387.1 DUF1853 family protein [Herbaspirillum sp. 3R11]TFI17295.1 DUF1853 family protein [Herbaspirillum sp. 3R-11]TFI23447.1 DUF1853 family protein [Herbaspirillum sp. 3C11]
MPTPQTDLQTAPSLSCQQQFHRRWSSLRDPHVRALAWLLDAPDLLDAQSPRWNGRIASLGTLSEMDITWLQALDKNPRELYLLINTQPSARLGRYAEKLLTFYLQQTGRLLAHNVQVRNGPNDTIGEFDFIVHDEAHGDGRSGVVHWEFATKFYLLEAHRDQMQADAFVGPNLADSLGAKMDKIMQQQLMLSAHPAAAQYLPQPVTRAQALVKGWLFYGETTEAASIPAALGISAQHCRGFWCELSALEVNDSERYLVLPRLEWLAPARAATGKTLSRAQLLETVQLLFNETLAPVMIAVCDVEGDVALERRRGFLVPDDWRGKAAQRVQHAVVQI